MFKILIKIKRANNQINKVLINHIKKLINNHKIIKFNSNNSNKLKIIFNKKYNKIN